jgi:hypothetical protein
MKEALKPALEALEKLARLGNGEHYGNSDGNMIARAAIPAIKAALAQECPNLKNCKGACFQCEYFNVDTGMMEYPAAQPSQEPVAWMREDATLKFAEGKVFSVGQPFYITPQPAQEPVAWVTKRNVIVEGLWEEEITFSEFDDGGDPVYYTPQQRRWVGLTDEEIREIHSASAGKDVGFATGLTEAKLKEKNT